MTAASRRRKDEDAVAEQEAEFTREHREAQSKKSAVMPMTEAELIGVALKLGAREVDGWSLAEEKLCRTAAKVSAALVNFVREQIRAGLDPLGDAFCTLRPAADRRKLGATFTPAEIVQSMVQWAAGFGCPDRIVDPGLGSARFLLTAARQLPNAKLIGIDVDPLPAIIARANASADGHARRTTIILGDYRSVRLASESGQTLFIGNPPYVRHHHIQPHWKRWLTERSAERGLVASQLAGLHVYFFLATALKASKGDYGTFITAAEWLDVNYGSLMRQLFLNDLGGRQFTLIEPRTMPFPDAAATAAITYFQIGEKPPWITVGRTETPGSSRTTKQSSRRVRREDLQSQRRWSTFSLARKRIPKGFVELGELCRVHRGQVTGLNRVWVVRDATRDCLPNCVLFHAVTKARELFAAGDVLNNLIALRQVIDIPIDLDALDYVERRQVDRFLLKAKRLGANQGYIAQKRRAWWSVGLREPAPILATYMARRPPAFVLNPHSARHINIAHGIYPRQKLAEGALPRLARYLQCSVDQRDGRTYAGGLTKFEPKEMERLLVPGLELLVEK